MTNTGITPRAWRMIGYSCVGFLIYGIFTVMENAQTAQINHIDAQMQMIADQDSLHIDESLKTSSTAALSGSTLPATSSASNASNPNSTSNSNPAPNFH